MRKKLKAGPIVPVPRVSRAAAPAAPPSLAGRPGAGTKPAKNKPRQEAAAKTAPPGKCQAESAALITERAHQRPRRAEVLEAVSSAMLATEARVWDPELVHSVTAPAPVSTRAQRPPLLQERRRVEALRRLRLSFADACRPLASPAGLVGAFERWHFGWLLESRGASSSQDGDPLLPNADAPNADDALEVEVRAAGADTARATAVVSALRQQARQEAAALAGAPRGLQGGGFPDEGQCGGGQATTGRHGVSDASSGAATAAPRVDDVSIEAASGGRGLVHVRWSEQPPSELPLKLRSDHLDKLREMHRRVAGGTGPGPAGQGPTAKGPIGKGPAPPAGEVAGEAQFRHDLLLLLLRYKGLGGSGFQAALGGGAHEALRSGFGCQLECFASPLNARSAPFCSGERSLAHAELGHRARPAAMRTPWAASGAHSAARTCPPTPHSPQPTTRPSDCHAPTQHMRAHSSQAFAHSRARCIPSPCPRLGFADVDSPFGSIGSFFDLHPMTGSFQANPPFVPPLVTAMVAHMRSLLDAADRRRAPLLFATVVGASAAMRRSAAWQALLNLASSAHGRAHWDIPLHRHGYTDGHAHISAEAARMSSCPSAVFIFATTAAHAAFPPTSDKEAAVRAGMQLAVPRNLHKASKANRRVHLQKKKRKRKRLLSAT